MKFETSDAAWGHAAYRGSPIIPLTHQMGEGRGEGKAFFRREERTLHLLYEAETWLGTIWCPNSSTVGAGVSCHNLPRSIYIACGALPESFPPVIGDPAGVTSRNEMELFLDKRPEFSRIFPTPSPPRSGGEGRGEVAWEQKPLGSILQPGDLVGLFLPLDSVGRRVKQRSVNHLGIVLGNGVFVHVLAHKHVDFDQVQVPPWSQRITAAWRPLEGAR